MISGKTAVFNSPRLRRFDGSFPVPAIGPQKWIGSSIRSSCVSLTAKNRAHFSARYAFAQYDICPSAIARQRRNRLQDRQSASKQEDFMADSFKIDFQAHGKVETGDLIVFVGGSQALAWRRQAARREGGRSHRQGCGGREFQGQGEIGHVHRRFRGLSVDQVDRGRNRRRKDRKAWISSSSAAWSPAS